MSQFTSKPVLMHLTLGEILIHKLLLSLVPTLGLAEPLRVFASVVPIQTFVQKIGREHVDARAMVRPGFNPHTCDPTPQQLSTLAGAALYLRTGVPFEKAWMKRIHSADPGIRVPDARDGIDLRELEAERHEASDQDHAHSAEAPHGDHDAAFSGRLS